MAIDEIVLPITDPETEWVRGRPLQKVSPRRNHARLQMKFATALDAALGTLGEAGTEWRFRIAVPGEPRRPLVPDVAFVAFELLRGRTEADIQAPDFAPTVAVEVLSPGDDPRDMASKVDVYLRGGSALVIVVDPAFALARAARRDGLAAPRDGRRTRTRGAPGHAPRARPVFRLGPRSAGRSLTHRRTRPRERAIMAERAVTLARPAAVSCRCPDSDRCRRARMRTRSRTTARR